MVLAEAPAEYDPWGRPGVGVGPGVTHGRDQSQQKAALSHRKQEYTSQQQQQVYLQNNSSQQETITSNEQVMSYVLVPSFCG